MKQRPEFISIGIITKAFGIKGEMLVYPLTDNPEQLKQLKNVLLSDGEKERQLFTVQRVKEKNNLFILKLDGIDDRNQAISFQKFLIEKRLEDSEELSPNEYYIFDLIGLKVITTDNQQLGELKDVLSLPANDVYVVQDGAKEILIPAIKSVIKKVDLKKEILIIELVDGLLE